MRTSWTQGGSKLADSVFDSTEPCEREKRTLIPTYEDDAELVSVFVNTGGTLF